MLVRAALILFVIATSLISGAASLAAPRQLPLTIQVLPGKDHIQLSWTPDAAFCTYEVHRSTTPYLSPDLATIQATLQAGSSSYVDYGAAHNAALNYTYVVRGLPCAGEPVRTAEVGEFDFGLEGSDSAVTVAYQTYGIDFSPYTGAGEDPNKGDNQITDEELADRIGMIAPYTEWVRTFGCNNDLKEAGKFSHTMGLKAALGAWLGPETNDQERQSNRDQIACLKARIAAGEADVAIVGSEVLYRNNLSETELIAYINDVRQFVQAQGLSVPVTTADVYGELLAHPNVVAEVAFVFPNYYPFWEGKDIEYAMANVHRWHQRLIDAYPGKEVIVSESGWPCCGNQVGEAVPSPENATAYFLNFVSWARAEGVKYFYFSAMDEPWKAAPEGPQGACWGVWTKDGVMKPGMERVFQGDMMADNWTNSPPD